MKIYLDDVRELPRWTKIRQGPWVKTEGWTVCRSAEEALALIASTGLENIEIISFDHDLGLDVMSGYDLAAILEEMVYEMELTKVPMLSIHSANPVGAMNMIACFESIRRRVERNTQEMAR